MTNQELFKQAIADARAVRDAAVANAKSALEETFTPKIMAMLSSQLNELEEEGNLEEEKDLQDEGFEDKVGYDSAQQKPSIEETELEEILAQLSEEDDSDDVTEAKKEEEGKNVEEAKKKDDKEKVEESLDEAEGSDEVTELTVDELKDMIRDVMKDVMGGGEEAGDEAGEGDDIDLGDEGDDDVAKSDEDEDKTLDELLSELMAESKDKKAKKAEEEKSKKEKMKKDKVEESIGEINEADLYTMGIQQLSQLANLDFSSAEALANALGGGAALSTVIGLLRKGIKADKAAGASSADIAKGVGDKMSGNMEEAKKDLEEAIKTINTLRDELNEVNLLNAKLLYSNKIFKAKSLSESQKVNVLKAFDRATSIKETKTIYATLSESLNARPKSTIKESVGFASKAAGVTPKQPIVEGDAAIRRMQQLAGIIK